MDDSIYYTIDELVSSDNEENAMIFGGLDDDEEKCTFPRGYLKRQAIFLCKTCQEITGKRAGICFVCSVNCHDGHEIIELYTRRHFRCDCGNSNFKGASVCKLCEEKDDVNAENKYDHNFDGVFCTCLRPYPDPDSDVGTEMFQCCVCEDWFHLNHIGLASGFKPSDDFEELICLECVKRFPFLWLFYYSQAQSNDNTSETCSAAKRPRLDENKDRLIQPVMSENVDCCKVPQVLSDCGVDKLEPSAEDLSKLKVNELAFPSPIFWCNDWRKETLCGCESCRTMLKVRGIEFLLDTEDSVEHYMEIGRQKLAEITEKRDKAVSQALAELPHAAAIEVAHGINRFKRALTEFINRPRDGNVVTEAEVLEFCENLKRRI